MKKARGIDAYRGKIRLEANKIIINGVSIGVNDFDKLPADLHPANICTEKRGDVTFYYKQDSPLSNHHECDINLEGFTYSCTEQVYYVKKAEICKDLTALASIKETRDPKVQKQIGDRIQSCEEWETKKVSVMRKACEAKFHQNPKLMEFLMGTGHTYICEDNPNDHFWSIGMTRNNPKAANAKNLKGNEMGKILNKIRDDQLIMDQ
jgi:hypothetical protein